MINIAVSLLKMKVVAVLLGPAGVGLIGLYTSLLQTGATVAGLGMNNSGIRQIAAAQAAGGDIEVGRVRRSLFWAMLTLAILGAMLFWLAREWIARVVLSDPSLSREVGWLAIALALSVGSGSQGALLTGMRRVSDLARIGIMSGVLSAMSGVLAVWLWGRDGLVALILVAPAATFLLGHLYVARLGPPPGTRATFRHMARDWRKMASLGFAFMISALITTLGHLAVRTLVQRELGTDALGQFQAAWAIGATYLGFVLGAMGTDYYPRLAAAINDPVTARRLVNEQTEVGLLLCAPVLLAMLGMAPWVIQLLYTTEFAPAVDVLRWQLLGDLLKVMSWPLGLILVAAGAGRMVLITETAAIAVFILGTFIALPLIGVQATGVAFLAMYAVHLPLTRWLGGRLINFKWSRAVKAQAVAVIALALVVDIAARVNPWLGAALGLSLALLTGTWALTRLAAQAGAGGRLGRIGAVGERVRGWIICRA